MREILFRGKRVDNSKWMKGDLIGVPSHPHIENNVPDLRAVIPETVGQYTGITDKNGVKIFEGDIVVWDYNEADFDGSTHSTPELVRWDKDCCGFIVNDDGEGTIDENCRVIGNIHDNSELLKRGIL